MPRELQGAIRQLASDFDAATRTWIAEGWHTAEEVEGWRVEMRRLMQECSFDKSYVMDLCAVWQGVAGRMEGVRDGKE